MKKTTSENAPRKVRNAYKDPILAAVRVEMLKRGIDYTDLAQRLGYAPGTMRNVLGGKEAPVARRKIEEFFGRPFWSTAGNGADGTN